MAQITCQALCAGYDGKETALQALPQAIVQAQQARAAHHQARPTARQAIPPQAVTAAVQAITTTARPTPTMTALTRVIL